VGVMVEVGVDIEGVKDVRVEEAVVDAEEADEDETLDDIDVEEEAATPIVVRIVGVP